MSKLLLLFASHIITGLIGFAAGIYFLPILIAPPPPAMSEIMAIKETAQFKGEFRLGLKGNDALHWGEGEVSISPKAIVLNGKLAPGPDYKLYLSPEFVETEEEFFRLRDKMVRVGDVRTFQNFFVEVPQNIQPADFNTVIVWCETFNQFITAAKYQ